MQTIIRFKKVFLILIIFCFIFEFENKLYSQITVTITANQDADMYMSNPDNAYGTTPTIYVGNNDLWRGLVNFDLSSIPSGAIITSATLKLAKVGGSSNNLEIGVYSLTNQWSDAYVTWNRRLSGVVWSNAGGDYNSTLISSTIVGSSNVTYSWDVTSTVQNWVSGTVTNYGLIMKGLSSTTYTKYFASLDGSTNDYPTLYITYEYFDPNLWLRANYGTNSTTEGAQISTWTDVVNNSNFTQSSNRRPIYRATTNLINFNPTVEFDGSNDYLSGASNYGISGTNKFTTFTVLKQTGSNDIIWGQNTNSAYQSINTTQRFGISNSNYISGTNTIGTTNPALLGIRRNSTGNNSFNLYYNGIIENSNGTISGFGGSFLTNSINLGRQGNASSYFQGNIAEFLIFDRTLSDNEVNIVNSYLALKYGISKNSEYLASNNSSIWTTGSYSNGIFGIGRDDETALNQQIARSTSDNVDILTVSTDSNFLLPNEQHSSINNNLSFLIFSNNATANITTQTTEIDNTIYLNRINREWFIRKTNFSGTINLKFDGIASTSDVIAYLIVKNNNSDFSSETNIIGELNSVGEIYNVVLNNNDYFTIAFKNTFPGGVSNDLKFWLKADAGVILSSSAVSQWNDQSGNNRNIVQNTSSNRPTILTNGQNFNPTVHFTASNNQFFSKNSNFNIFADSYSIYLVGYNSSGQRTFITVNETGGTDNSGIHIESQDPSIMRFLHRNPPSQGGGDNLVQTVNISNSRSNVMSFYRNTTTKHKFSINSENAFSLTPSVAAFTSGVFTDLTVGQLGSENQRYLDGDIGEIIIYNTDNESNRIRIESYLGVKYGVSLNDGIGVNYTASNGSTIFWNNILNSGYNNDVFGIGRDDLSLLTQKQSRSINTDAFFTLYHLTNDSDPLPTTNQLNGSTIPADKSFIMFGNDNGDITQWYRFSESPKSMAARVERIWKVQKTGTINNVIIVINTSDLPSNTGTLPLYLLVSNSSDMSNADYFPMTLDGSTWRIAYNFTTNTYISFGYGLITQPMRHGKSVINGELVPYK